MSPRPRFGDADSDGMRTSVVAGSLALFAAFAVIGYLLCLQLGIKGWHQLAVIVGFGASASSLSIGLGLGFARTSAAAFARFVAPNGTTTPYQYGYSYQQVLAAKGDVIGALESYEAVLRERPTDAEALAQAAELYATSGNAARAVELFRALRAIPGVGDARDIYASNRLVDLYLLTKQDGRALVELRRLVERYGRTDAGARARGALGRLKAAPEAAP
jgi:tetratricopeptide (TPR) repeat protein